MIQKTRGIILHRYKYSDSKMIVNVYTEEYGLTTCLFYISKSLKNRMQMNLLQPFYMNDILLYYKENANFQTIKEVSLSLPLAGIYNDIRKNTISVFLAEFILKVIRENEPDHTLFCFLWDSIIDLNEEAGRVTDFHLFFLFRLASYLGIEPLMNYSEENNIFDLKSGRFVAGYPNHSDYLNFRMSSLFSDILNKENKGLLQLSYVERTNLLEFIIQYYQIHLERPGELKSLKIMKSVFS